MWCMFSLAIGVLVGGFLTTLLYLRLDRVEDTLEALQAACTDYFNGAMPENIANWVKRGPHPYRHH